MRREGKGREKGRKREGKGREKGGKREVKGGEWWRNEGRGKVSM